MKQIMIAFVIFLIPTLGQSQTITFTNNSNCDVTVGIGATNGSTCVDYSTTVYYVIPKGVIGIAFDMFPGGSGALLNWATPPSSGSSFSFVKFHEGDPNSCSFGSGSSSCGTGGRMSFNGVYLCAGYSSTSCFEVSTGACNICPSGSYVTADIVSTGSGSAHVDFY